MKHSFSIDKGSIRMVVSHKGKLYRRATGLTTDPALWNKEAKTLAAKCRDKRIWPELRAIHLRAAEKQEEARTEQDVLRIIEYAITGSMPSESAKTTPSSAVCPLTFWEYFKEWSEQDCSQKRQKKLCYNNIVRFMGTDFDWDDVDSAFHFRLVQKMQEANFGINYQWKTISQLKTVMNEGRKLKYHHNLEFQDFKTKREDPDTVYLTKDEIELLWEYEPKGELDRKARDLFLLGVYSCARFSDYSRLSMDMIHDGVVHFTQVKTASSVMVPASPRLIAILERNGGAAPHLEQQHLNEWIKRVCRDCGIDTPVEITTSNGLKHTTEVRPKWKCVSSHAARRSGIVGLYMTGIPLKQVMLISGHRDEDSLRHYLRITKEENAELLKDNPFFK